MNKSDILYKALITFSILLLFISGSAQISRKQYIESYKGLAIREMKKAGIPASITLAQAVLESDDGNSKLARKAKNHFGIKCHNWKGKTYHQDDDAKDECFRKYSDVEDSYKDHSAFLQRDRYADLFKLKPTDYKGWAKGLKKAGYATNPKYPQLLIRIIEDNQLYQYDDPKYQHDRRKKKEDDPEEVISDITENQLPGKEADKKDVTEEYVIQTKKHQIKLNNRVKYIVCKKGDTFQSLNKELDLLRFVLPKYNELEKHTVPKEGQVLYIQPKKNKAEAGYDFHTVEEGETMYSISQKYAIKSAKLYEMNNLFPGSEPKPGDLLYLRNRK
jgi:LysM repeat protein